MRRYHDLGGTTGGPIVTEAHEARPWAKTLTAIVGALRTHDLMRVDELRRALEDLPTEIYDKDYFERWAEAVCNLLEEKRILTREEVGERMAALAGRLEADG